MNSLKTYHVLLLCLNLVIFIPTLAQHENQFSEREYLKYKSIFQKELDALEEESAANETSKYSYPAGIPDWAADLSCNSASGLKAIGISDPGMDYESGIELAIIRGKTVLSLMHNALIRSITDYYTSETNSGKKAEKGSMFGEYFNFKSSITVDTSRINILETHTTASGEHIVLLTYHKNNTESSPGQVYVEAEMMNEEFMKNGVHEINTRLEVYGDERDGTTLNRYLYDSWIINDLATYNSFFNEQNIKHLNTYLKYKNLNALQADTLAKGARLSTGLWNAYLFSILKELSLFTKAHAGHISEITDNYTLQTQDLNREIIETRVSFTISSLSIASNRLHIELNIDKH